MPEGERRLVHRPPPARGAGGTDADPQRLPCPPAGHRRPDRRRRDRDRLARQAPAHQDQERPHRPHPPADGRQLAGPARGRATPRQPPDQAAAGQRGLAGHRVPARRGRADPHQRGVAGHRAPGTRPARPGLGPRRGGAAAERRTGPPHRRGPARPAEPGRHRQRVQGRGAVPARPQPVAADRASVADLGAVAELARRLLEANKERLGHITTGSMRRGEEHWVYGRRGQPCRRCGTPVRSAGQDDRVTFWCPSCQPG